MAKRSDTSTPGSATAAFRESREYARSFDALEQIYAFVEPVFKSRGLGSADAYAIIMAIEELFTNMVKYNPTGSGMISLQLECASAAVTCRLSDPDSDRFDMTRAPEVDINRPAEEREPGGLGIHLIRRMVDSIDYQYHGRCSQVSFVKKLCGALLANPANS